MYEKKLSGKPDSRVLQYHYTIIFQKNSHYYVGVSQLFKKRGGECVSRGFACHAPVPAESMSLQIVFGKETWDIWQVYTNLKGMYYFL